MTSSDRIGLEKGNTVTHLQEWITALNSGDYNQGSGSLSASETEHCCLGVLAEIAKAPHHRNYPTNTMLVEHQSFAPNENEENEEITQHTEGISDTMLDAEWFFDTVGLSPTDQEGLAYCNDNGVTFAQIANVLSSDNPSDSIGDLVQRIQEGHAAEQEEGLED